LSDPAFRRQLRQRLAERWSFEKIEAMTTSEIFAYLKQIGITVTPKHFIASAKHYDSTERLAHEWTDTYTLRPQQRYDADFVWMAAFVLWKRLIRNRICFEQIDERMQEGYTLLEQDRRTEACDAWWQTWTWTKEKITPERDTLHRFDKDFRGTQSVFNWCQDFEVELGNAGFDDPQYYRMRIRYCQEFLASFRDINWLMRGNFLRAEAESYWHLGEIETAEAKFEALVQANPDWAWGYVGWSDEYWLYRHSPKAYDQAEAILERALQRPELEDRGVVRERLEDLRAEREGE
jgi:tetratricopeptide (TPR) repeat protein